MKVRLVKISIDNEKITQGLELIGTLLHQLGETNNYYLFVILKLESSWKLISSDS